MRRVLLARPVSREDGPHSLNPLATGGIGGTRLFEQRQHPVEVGLPGFKFGGDAREPRVGLTVGEWCLGGRHSLSIAPYAET